MADIGWRRPLVSGDGGSKLCGQGVHFKHYFDRLIGGSYFSTPSTPRLYSTPWVVARCAIGQESPNRIAELKMRRGTRHHRTNRWSTP